MTEQTEKLCPICRKPLNAFPMGDKNGYSLIACRSCGTVMTQPLVSADAREKFFGDIQPEITHVPNPASEIEGLKKTIKKIAPPAGLTGRRFLDVGCRNGYAVVAAKALGLDAKGIDAHDFFIRFAQAKYDPALFENISAMDYNDGQHRAEILFARECFNEQTDPEAFTKALAGLLAPGGLLYIEEPDGNSFNTPGNFASWQVAYPPMNFIYYSKKGLTALLNRHGFTVQKMFFTWAPKIRLIAIKQ